MRGHQKTVDIAVPAPGRVLLIDDSELIRGFIEEFLVEQGWTVQGASSGDEGLEIARTWGAEAVLCDLQMPGMDGYQVLRHLRALDPSLPVIFLSGDSDISIVLRAVEEGAFDYKLKASDDLRPLVAALGRAVNYCRLTRDNTRLEKELAAAKVETSRRLGQFVGKIGQELRAPLKAIVGYAELLRNEAEEGRASNLREDIKNIEVASRHLLGVASELIDYSRLELGKMPIASASFDVRDLLSEVRDAMRPLAEKGGGNIDLDLGDSLGAMESDESRLRQILIALVANLCRRPKHGPIRIRAERERDADGVWIAFDVIDQGGVVEPHVLGQLFEPFSPVSQSRAPDSGEMGPGASGARSVAERHGDRSAEFTSAGYPGLGLAMSRSMSHALGGELTLRNDATRGAKFSLRLPARIASSNTTADFMFPAPDDNDRTDKMAIAEPAP